MFSAPVSSNQFKADFRISFTGNEDSHRIWLHADICKYFSRKHNRHGRQSGYKIIWNQKRNGTRIKFSYPTPSGQSLKWDIEFHKKGNSYSVVRHQRGYFYVQRRKNSSVNSEANRKLKNDLRITRKNNSIYRKIVSGMGHRFSLWILYDSYSKSLES